MKQYKCSMSKKKESLASKNEKLFMLYDIHHNYPDFGKMSCWRNPQFWKDYEDYYSKAYPTMGIKITMKDNDSVDVTSNGKFIMNYSWKNGRHRATAEDGSGFKHPGFGFRDDLSMIYRGVTGKEMGPYNSVYVDESRKKSEDADGEEAYLEFEDAVKLVLMDKYGVVDSHGPSDETANSLVLQYGATLRDAFDKGGNGGYSPESEALYIITDRLHEAPHFFDDCKNFKFKAGESHKKSEGISDMIDAKIDYNMFMRMCKTAAYLEEDEDYWDALWEYFSEVGSIGDALVFFDNLFQYTAWKTAEELWSDFSDTLGDKPEGKDYEEALDAYLEENDNEVANAAAFKYGDHYLMVY